VLADSFDLAQSDTGPSYRQLEELVQQRAHEVLAEGQALATAPPPCRPAFWAAYPMPTCITPVAP
jgi:hypothetical protein